MPVLRRPSECPWLRPGSARAVAAVVLAALASSAAAQGYECTLQGEPAFVEAPADATPCDVASDTGLARVDLPFGFRYFGEASRALDVSPDGWVVVRAARGLGEGDDDGERVPTRLPIEAGSAFDGVLAVLATERAPAVAPTLRHWQDGAAPSRRVIVEWAGLPRPGARAQLHLHEGAGRVVFAYSAAAVTGDVVSSGAALRGIDEPGGDRFVTPPSGADSTRAAPTDVRFEPRTVVECPPGLGEQGVPVRWIDTRKEATVPDGCTRRCTYLGKGLHYFHVPDRASKTWTGTRWRAEPRSLRDALATEDRATFGDGRDDVVGDHVRWVRQVLDGKVLLLPADGGAPLRIWFRIVEYFSLDDRAIAGADYHTWNVRWMLANAFPGNDPREDIDRYQAWKATARGRLTVGKLFTASQTDDAGRQFDSGRKREYELSSGRLTTGVRGVLAPYATPPESWTRFVLMEEDMRITQHADRGDLRFVADPNYVDGGYEYTIAAPDNDAGWIYGRALPGQPLRDEGIDDDPGRAAESVTPR